MRRCLVAAGVVAGLLSFAGPPAAANPPAIVVVDCPASPVKGSPPLCRGRAAIRCATTRGDRLEPNCDAQVVVMEAAGHRSWMAQPMDVGTDWSQVADYVPEWLRSYLFPEVEVRFGRPGVSFSIDSDGKRCPRCRGGS